MNDEELYAEEAKQRWGHTEAYRQSQERVSKMTKEEMKKVSERGDELMKKIIDKMSLGANNEEVQKLIGEHYNNLRTFYEPNIEMYRGLADMYIADPRFTKFFDRFHPRLTQFMHDAMIIFCNKNIPN